jgi:chromosome segregation ATPase
MDSKQLDRTYGEMIYSLLSEMNGALWAQLRNLNNSLANDQRVMLDLQTSINNLIEGLKETREKRYQEEIDSLEAQMRNLQHQLSEKKVAKVSTSSTSEKIRAVSLEVVQQEQKKKQIDWLDVRNKVLPYVLGAVVLSIIISLLPEVGRLLVAIFTPR